MTFDEYLAERKRDLRFAEVWEQCQPSATYQLLAEIFAEREKMRAVVDAAREYVNSHIELCQYHDSSEDAFNDSARYRQRAYHDLPDAREDAHDRLCKAVAGDNSVPDCALYNRETVRN